MSRKKKTQFALLGLLSWKPMSGYDIKKIVDIGLSHFWNENYGQIYPTLDELVKAGFARKSIDATSGKRKRYVYRITPAGVAVFQEWLAQPADVPTVRNELQLKFFLSSKLPAKNSLRMIREYQQQQQTILEEYRASEVELRQAIESGNYPDEVLEILEGHEKPQTAKQQSKQCRIFLLTLRHGILAIEGRMKWCNEVINEIATRAK
jgi:DNA-binding PadR family transcriptional regulator